MGSACLMGSARWFVSDQVSLARQGASVVRAGLKEFCKLSVPSSALVINNRRNKLPSLLSRFQVIYILPYHVIRIIGSIATSLVGF